MADDAPVVEPAPVGGDVAALPAPSPVVDAASSGAPAVAKPHKPKGGKRPGAGRPRKDGTRSVPKPDLDADDEDGDDSDGESEKRAPVKLEVVRAGATPPPPPGPSVADEMFEQPLGVLLVLAANLVRVRLMKAPAREADERVVNYMGREMLPLIKETYPEMFVGNGKSLAAMRAGAAFTWFVLTDSEKPPGSPVVEEAPPEKGNADG